MHILEYMFLGLMYFFFEEMPVQIFCPFFKWIFLLLLLSFFFFFFLVPSIVWILISVRWIACNFFFPVSFFTVLIVPLTLYQTQKLLQSGFYCLSFWGLYTRSQLLPIMFPVFFWWFHYFKSYV